MTTDFTDTDSFKAAFQAKAASGEKFVVIFTGTINEATGESWCPDCVVAKPNIARIVEAGSSDKAFLKGIVSRNEWMGNKDHPYRQAPFGA